MIEIRNIVYGNVGYEKLQYRYIKPCVDASGRLCPSDMWSEWKDVKSIDGMKIKDSK